METTKAHWEKLKNIFFQTETVFTKSAYQNEYNLPFPTDAKKAFVYDDSHTIYLLKNGRFEVNINGAICDFKTLKTAKCRLWNEFVKWETV